MRGRVLSDILDPDENSFNLVRLIAALAVLVSHSYSFAYAAVPRFEPLDGITPFTLGQHAVNAFFVISGLTLSNSINCDPDLVRYVWSRFLRIFPALWALGFVFAFVAGPFLTSLSLEDYFSDAHTWAYPFAVLVQFARAVPPHEIFLSSPFPNAANVPLWTIKYELFAYIGLAAFSCLGLLRSVLALSIALAASITLVLITSMVVADTDASWLHHLGRYGLCFLIGMAAYRFREHINLSPWLLVVSTVLAGVLNFTPLREVGWILFVGHLVLVIGAIDFGALTRLTRKDDLSYGAYIYAWPVQQTLISLMPGTSFLTHATLATIFVFLLAFASWTLIERPALRLKRNDPLKVWRSFAFKGKTAR